MDSYLLRFERYATAQKWEPDTWATGLSALLQGKALDVYALMPKEDALNYDKLKVALLKRYELTEEGFKRKYKKCRPENGETFQQFLLVQLFSYKIFDQGFVLVFCFSFDYFLMSPLLITI